jgi:hypothetical protein
MSAIRTCRCLTSLVGTFLLTAALLSGCSQSPEEPVFANPFEPGAPGSGDPFNLRAVYGAGRVTLTWNPLDGHGIATYVVTWIFEGNAYELDHLEPIAGPMNYIVQDPVPNITNYYRIRALDAFGRAAAVSHVVPAAVQVPPIIRLSSGQTQVRTRFPDVVVRAAAGDYAQLDLRNDFANALQVDITDSVAVFPSFDLGPRPSASARCTLYARAAFDLGGDLPPMWSPTDQLVLTIQFSPTIIRPDTSTTVALPLTDLVVSNGAVGVQSMRFANTADDLQTAPWLPGAPVVVDVPLLDTPQPQTVHAEFRSEFGFTHPTTLNLRADDLTGATFRLVLPANRVATTPLVPIRNQARATEMRISQDPGFADAPWIPYTRETEIFIAGEPGLHQVFAWFRNHWFESAILVDHVILSGASLEVAFLHPTAGQVVRGGTTLTVTGTAATFDGAYPLTLVEVHTGDGWQPAAGTDLWSASWTVPRLTADTEVQIGARATATGSGGDTHTGVTWIAVLVSQLAVRITSPVAEAAVPRGGALTIAGTAAPFAGGAPLDSVVVAVPDGRLAADLPLATWSVDWDVPLEAELGPALLTAWAYADGDSASHEVPVTLVASEDEDGDRAR